MMTHSSLIISQDYQRQTTAALTTTRAAREQTKAEVATHKNVLAQTKRSGTPSSGSTITAAGGHHLRAQHPHCHAQSYTARRACKCTPTAMQAR